MQAKPLPYIINREVHPAPEMSIRAFAQSLKSNYGIKVYLSWTGCKMLNPQDNPIYNDGEYTPARAVGKEQMDTYRARLVRLVMYCNVMYPTPYITKLCDALTANKDQLQ